MVIWSIAKEERYSPVPRLSDTRYSPKQLYFTTYIFTFYTFHFYLLAVTYGRKIITIN